MSSAVRRENRPDGPERRPAIRVGMLAPFDHVCCGVRGMQA